MLRFLLTILLILPISNSYAESEPQPLWGKTGHRVVGAIADQYLKNSTKRAIKKLLNHESLAFVSTYADEIKSDKRYDQFMTWHYVNMPLDGTYEASKKNPTGDLVTGIEYCKQVVSSETSSLEDKRFYLKLLIHLIGDLHQPFHIGLEEDRGGNDFEVIWFNKDTNMHSIWDTKMIESFGMSYSEMAENAPYVSKEEIERIQSGSILDWVADTHQLTKQVYQSTTPGADLGNEYNYLYFGMIRSQLNKAGIRLAKVLNEIL